MIIESEESIRLTDHRQQIMIVDEARTFKTPVTKNYIKTCLKRTLGRLVVQQNGLAINTKSCDLISARDKWSHFGSDSVLPIEDCSEK